MPSARLTECIKSYARDDKPSKKISSKGELKAREFTRASAVLPGFVEAENEPAFMGPRIPLEFLASRSMLRARTGTLGAGRRVSPGRAAELRIAEPGCAPFYGMIIRSFLSA